MAREQTGTAQLNGGETKTDGRKDAGTSDREQRIQTGRDQQRSGTMTRRNAGSSLQPYARGASPFSLVSRMAEDMDRLFEDFAFGGGGFATPAWAPQIETFRRGDKLVVRADLPGLKREDVNVEVDNDVLTITGERRDEHEEDRDGYYRTERSYGSFYRALRLPEGVNADQLDAQFRDGVLEVTLPAPKENQQSRKRIEVR